MDNLREELQKKANHWNKILQNIFEDERQDSYIYHEYRGRIYAMRTLTFLLGIDVDTRLPWEWYDEKGRAIEPDYSFQ